MKTVALETAIQSIARSEEAGSVFQELLKALSATAPRGALFLIRRKAAGQKQLHGWSSFGYPADVARKQRGFTCAIRPEPPDFGQPQGAPSFQATLTVKGRPFAAVLLERGALARDGAPEPAPWDPAAASALCACAGLRLELTLAQRKLTTLETSAATATTASASEARSGEGPRAGRATPGRPDSRPLRLEEALAYGDVLVDPPTAVEVTALREVQPPQGAAEAPNLEISAARRFAKLVATDIRLYNEEAISLGRQNRDLAERLRPSIDRGKEHFVRRHGNLGAAGLELLREAYVHVLAGGEDDLLPDSVLK